MTVVEEPVVFSCSGESLVGIVSTASSVVSTGVIVIVGGPQYRAGSHRQFVLLARRIAASGHPVLRFDCRGMGDSSGEARTFESIGEDIAAAIDALQHHVPSVQRVVLWGLCDAASAALLYCDASRDHRIHALCLVNPWARGQSSEARTRIKHYYAQRLLQGEFWVKLLRGAVSLRALADLAQNVRAATRAAAPADYRERMASGWSRFGGPILLALSGRDFTAKEFLDHAGSNTAWARSLERRNLTRRDFDDADHTFSDIASRTALEDLTVSWLNSATRP